MAAAVPIGGFLESTFGIVVAFRWTGAALAAAIMGFPLLVRAIRLSIDAIDPGLESAAATLGANRLVVFVTVTLPLMLPGIIAGAVLAFARGLGEFGATITFVGNIPGVTQTIPTAIYTYTQIPGGEIRGAPADGDRDRHRLRRDPHIGSTGAADRPPDPRPMTIAVDVTRRAGAFTLAADFTSEGRVTALFGRSGAGKTTLVNLVAGLIRPDAGRIAIDGETLVDTERGIDLPAHRRRIGYVFQESRLFPHLSVRSNLLYGRRLTPRAHRWGSLAATVDLLGIGHLLSRRPAGLSGGERQRVALGRALLASPRLLLLDEPLAALDEARKADLLPYIERLRDEMRLPILYVSHSIDEVARIADTMVVLADGKAVASGTVADILARTDLRPFTGQAEASAVITAACRRRRRSRRHACSTIRPDGSRFPASGHFPPVAPSASASAPVTSRSPSANRA